ncbi:ABC transporter permease [Fulvivirga lutimaris]|uniref:ABC transporter permease n=1 Tax=Fulvivirga lutimaris TaxID=1819566 RepID=UPI0012BC579E|nr:ABC transporter permease [Fulvivirga lutimaris]MTI38652.1 FtsX-like permease family protein [Fulvivirga lutimaris]
MLKNYIKIAFRNLVRRIGYTSINVFGLAVGISCCLLIGIYVMDEISYDKFHANADNIYRVNINYSMGGTSQSMYVTPTALLPTMKREFNEVVAGTRLFDVAMFSPQVVSLNDVSFQEEKFFYADSTFFDIFSFELSEGVKDKALVEPNSVILSESMVAKYFGDNDALGEVIKVGQTEYKVTGVMKDIPDNSHLKFDFLASFSSLRASKGETWWSANYATYVLLSENADRAKIEDGIEIVVREALGEVFQNDDRVSFDLFPMTDIHLRSTLSTEMQTQGDIKYIYIISFIGFLILVIACINYMNLATARSMDRAREVGMRKVLGAVKGQLFNQFMGESIIVTTLAAIIALVIINIALVPFNNLTGKTLTSTDILDPVILSGLVSIIIVVAFLAGAYPALSISSLQPGNVLKGTFKRSKTGGLLRKVLVIVQFSISILLIIGTMVIYKQLNFMQNKKLGYSKDNILVLPTDRQVNKNFQSIKSALEQREDVVGVSMASESPTEINGGYGIEVQGVEAPNTNTVAITVDQEFTKNMEMEIIHGREFTEADTKLAKLDSLELRQYAFIVNEMLLNQLMISPEDALGRNAKVSGRPGQIVGVVKDFHFASLHRKINPLVLFIEPSQYNKLFIKVNSDNISQSLTEIESVWKQIVPERPFVYSFMDEDYDALYRSEERLGNIFIVFATLAIIIGCLGLLGLVSFTVQQRNKEIGVRKVLGASVSSIFILISEDFGKLILIAFLVAAPVGYYLMSDWLAGFEYKTVVGVLPIVSSIVITIVVAIATISYNSINAAVTNPVKTLRNE